MNKSPRVRLEKLKRKALYIVVLLIGSISHHNLELNQKLPFNSTPSVSRTSLRFSKRAPHPSAESRSVSAILLRKGNVRNETRNRELNNPKFAGRATNPTVTTRIFLRPVYRNENGNNSTIRSGQDNTNMVLHTSNPGILNQAQSIHM